MRFEGKTALVTGGSRGIGRACVAQLVSEGAKTAFLYHSSKEAADELVEELKDLPGEAIAYQADVKDYDRAHQLVDDLFQEWEVLDVLVNSAGIVNDGLLGAMTNEQWQSVIETIGLPAE